MERIRPIGYPQNDSPFTRRIIKSGEGWLRDITPNERQLERVNDDFRILLYKYGQQLRHRYAVDRRGGWPKARFGAIPRDADERLAYVFARNESLGSQSGKVADLLQYEFLRLGLALRYEFDGVTWLGFHPQLASVYMCDLAEIIADDRSLVPVTDNGKVHYAATKSTALIRLERALGGDMQDPPKLDSYEVEAQYIEIALRSVLNPSNLGEIPIERILEFRGTHKKEMQAFQDHVFNLHTDILEICKISDAEELQYRLQDLYKSRTKPELNDLQRRLRRFGIHSMPSMLKLRIDKVSATQTIGGAVTVMAAHAMTGATVPVALPVGIAVVAIPYIRSLKREKENLKHESPASLLLAVQNELTHI